MSEPAPEVQDLVKSICEYGGGYAKNHDTYIGYGTAGFRTKATLLPHVMFRVGVVAALRSKVTKASIGVMITASHNPEPDNGVKLVDPRGEMLAANWEIFATTLANASNEEFPKVLQELIINENIPLQQKSSVFIGRDTRESSPRLLKAVVDGLKGFGIHNCSVTDYGIVSTPILHYMVVCGNYSDMYGPPVLENYYKTLSNAFTKIMKTDPKNKLADNYVPAVTLDGSNGVGADVTKTIYRLMDPNILKINIINAGGADGVLNEDCGADFVKVKQRGPAKVAKEHSKRFVSFDGDADRIIYFYYDKDLTFHMLDGDKIAVLMARHLGDLVKEYGLDLKLGLVQTAYANGSSTNYIEKTLGIPVSCTLTGVKHLHHEAIKNYDIGVYFEANGHGTVVFSENALKTIKNAEKEAPELYLFTRLINTTVGDALADMLVVEAILHSKGWSIEDWDKLYTDLPNRQLKVSVTDRSIIRTTNAERTVSEPAGVQDRIDQLVSKYPNGRSFVRPSGTEDIVRVYAEADTQDNADKLGKEVAAVVFELCGGIGDKPDQN